MTSAQSCQAAAQRSPARHRSCEAAGCMTKALRSLTCEFSQVRFKSRGNMQKGSKGKCDVSRANSDAASLLLSLHGSRDHHDCHKGPCCSLQAWQVAVLLKHLQPAGQKQDVRIVRSSFRQKPKKNVQRASNSHNHLAFGHAREHAFLVVGPISFTEYPTSLLKELISQVGPPSKHAAISTLPIGMRIILFVHVI